MGDRTAAAVAGSAGAIPVAREKRIPGAFQLLLALYIILTGDFPTIVQALAFGLPGGADTEFAAAMLTSLTRDFLLLAAVVALASHPLGILHPLLFAVVVWPVVTRLPSVIEEYGGWAGIIGGLPVQTPFFTGLPSQDASVIWTAIAKYHSVEIVALLCIYLGFWLFTTKQSPVRGAVILPDVKALRPVLLGLFGLSIFVLLAYVYTRGGIGEHLTSLGRGRFRELAGDGPIIVATGFGAIALFLWIAARPGDVRSPLFLACLGAVVATQFISNGSRGAAMAVPLVVGLIWSLRRRQVPWKTALLLIPILFILFGLLGAIRTSSWYGSTAGEAWSTTTWQESMQRAQAELSERRSIAASIPIVERGFEVSGGPMLGQTYLAAVTAVIPRALWEDKPRGPGSIYLQQFFGAAREGNTIPVSPEAEAYWNFWWPGVIVLAILYGALLRMVYNFFWRRYPNPFAIVFFALFVTTFKINTKGLVDLQQQLILLFICYVAVAIFVPRVRSQVTIRDTRLGIPSFRTFGQQF